MDSFINLTLDHLILFQAIFTMVLAIGILVARSIFVSALFFLGVLISTAAIYLLLDESLLAALQLIIYAGAIVVLFLFSIMLVNPRHETDHLFRRPLLYVVTFVVLGGFVMLAQQLFLFYARITTTATPGPYTESMIATLGGRTQALAQKLFTSAFIMFELVALALVVGLIAAMVLAKRRPMEGK